MLLQLIFRILLGKDVRDMAIVYATLIIKGKKAYVDVPERLKSQVREVLADLELTELAE